MKTRLPFLVIVMLLILASNGCSEKPVQPDTPANTAMLMKIAIDGGNFERFKELFAEGRKEVITPEQFEAMKELTTPGSSYSHFELITFENDKMLLLRLTPEQDESGRYHIEDVKRIPDELKNLFEPTELTD